MEKQLDDAFNCACKTKQRQQELWEEQQTEEQVGKGNGNTFLSMFHKISMSDVYATPRATADALTDRPGKRSDVHGNTSSEKGAGAPAVDHTKARALRLANTQNDRQGSSPEQQDCFQYT